MPAHRAVAHAVAAADDAELHCVAPGQVDALFDKLGHLPQVGVPGDDVAEGVGDADGGAGQVLIVKPHRFVYPAGVQLVQRRGVLLPGLYHGGPSYFSIFRG